MLFNKKYDLVFSLGQACACTQTLRKFKLQFYSYPLDWLYGLNITERADILVNNYKDLLNYEDIEVTERNNNSNTNPCAVCFNKRNNIYFNHDFPLGKPAEETYPVIKEKYDRRIKRHLEQIEKSKKVLAVYLQAPNNRNEADDKTLIEVHSMLEKRFPKQEFTLLYLFCDHDKKDYELREISENVARIDFDYDAYSEDAPFSVNEDILVKVFYNVKITNKFVTVRNFWRRFFYRLKYLRKNYKIKR